MKSFLLRIDIQLAEGHNAVPKVHQTNYVKKSSVDPMCTFTTLDAVFSFINLLEMLVNSYIEQTSAWFSFSIANFSTKTRLTSHCFSSSESLQVLLKLDSHNNFVL